VFGFALLAFDFLCNHSGRDADWLQHLDSDSCWRDPLLEITAMEKRQSFIAK